MSDHRLSGRSWIRGLDLGIEVPAVIVAFVMMVVVTANALSRAFFSSPIPYTTEMTQYWFMPVVALLGFMAAQRRGQHIAADLIYSRIPRQAQKFFLLVLFLVAALLCAAIAYYGWGEAVDAFQIRKRAGIAPIPAWPVYFLVPISFGVMAIQFVTSAVGIGRHGPPQDDEATESEPGVALAGNTKEV